MMRAVVLQGQGQVSVVEAAEPDLLDGSVVVQVDRCGIGGSDVAAYTTGWAPSPAWFGHEWVGRVVAVGNNVKDRFEGERVVGAAPPACGHCRTCWAGFAQHCQSVLEMIVGADPLSDSHGAFAERVRVDARRVQRVPEGIDDNDAALVEPASVAAHAVARGAVGLGDIVAVVGAGTVGLIVADLARLAGAARVVAVETSSARRDLACDLGCDAAFEPSDSVAAWLARTGHRLGADVVFDCAGTDDSLSEAVGLVRQGGTVVAVGVTGSGRSPVPAELIARQIDLRASLGYTVGDVGRAMALMAEDRLRVEPIYSPDPIGLGEIPEVIAELAGPSSTRRKTLVDPSR